MDRDKIIETLESILDADNYDCWLSRGERESVCDAVDLLKEQEAVKPKLNDPFYSCGYCGGRLWVAGQKHCASCGRSVRWNDS